MKIELDPSQIIQAQQNNNTLTGPERQHDPHLTLPRNHGKKARCGWVSRGVRMTAALPARPFEAYVSLMDIHEAFRKAQPYLIGLGVPIAVLLAGVTLPIQIQQASAIGSLQAKVETIKDDIASARAEARQRADRIDAGLQKLSERLADRDPDPTKLLSMLTGFQEESLRAATVAYEGGVLYVLPRTQDFKDTLEKAGFKLEQITPTVSGFKVPLKFIGGSPYPEK